MLLLDVNGYHPAWGSRDMNNRGKTVINVAEMQNLVVLNDGSITRTSGIHQSAIDVSFASSEIVHRLSWKVLQDPLGSDHHPIIIQHDVVPTITNRRPRWKYNEARWDDFKALVETACRTNPPKNIEHLLDACKQAASTTIPRTSSKPGKRATHWWNETTKAAVKARRKALRKKKKLPTGHPDKQSAIDLYRIEQNKCRQIIRDAKKENWKEFLDGINCSQSATELWGRVNALYGKKRANGLTLNLSSGPTQDPQAICEALATHFAEISSIGKYDINFIRQNQISPNSISNIVIPDHSSFPTINEPFSINELNFALQGCKGKSAGLDDIGYPMLKNLPLNAKSILLHTFNEIWSNGTIPPSWKHSLVVPIPKQGNTSTKPEDFRPISLTCCSSKVLERMINRRLQQFLEDHNLLSYRQHAFRPGHGTNTYFAALGDIISNAIQDGDHVDIAALDIAKAYNRTWTPLIIHQLIEWGLGGSIVRFIRNFLTNRTFQVTVGNVRSSTYNEETGVAQGSVIAVTVFLVGMNDAVTRLPKDIFPLIYADDIVLLVKGKNPKALRRKLQAAVRTVDEWTKNTGYSLSASKSVTSHICHYSHNPAKNKTIKTSDGIIPFKQTVKILGIIIDRKFSFETHFKYVRSSLCSRMNLLRTMSSPHHTNNRHTLLRVAKAIVWSKLFYGLEIFCHARPLFLKKLQGTYNQTIRIVAGLLPSTPADSACIELGCLPLRYQLVDNLAKRAISYAAKTTGTYQTHIQTEGNNAFKELTNYKIPPVAPIIWTGSRRWNEPTLHFDTYIENKYNAGANSRIVKPDVNRLLTTKFANFTHNFTDGSKSSTGVGIGAIIDGQENSYKLPNQCSIFSAEAAAILLVIDSAPSEPTLILTDSRSCVDALRSTKPSHPWIQAIQQQISSKSVIIWIPAHVGIPGNERADSLAKRGQNGEILRNDVPCQDLKLWIKNMILNRWASDWIKERHLFIRKVKGETTMWNDRENSTEQKKLSRLRVGHTRITHNFQSGASFHRTCPTCDIKATVEHMLVNCPSFVSMRTKHNLPINIRDILANNKDNEDTLIEFLKDTKMYNNL